MGTWQKTEHFGCIIALAIVPFLIVGTCLLFVGLDMNLGAVGDLGIPRKYEILFLALLFITCPPISTVFLLWRVRRGQDRATWLRENGIPGTATLLRCEETGVVINNAPKIAMELEISTQQHPPYRIVHKECVGLLHLARLVPGKQFDVMVDPNDPEQILVEKF